MLIKPISNQKMWLFPQWSKSFLGKKKRNSAILFIFPNLIISELKIISKIPSLFVNMIVKIAPTKRKMILQEKVIKFISMGKLRWVYFVLKE